MVSRFNVVRSTHRLSMQMDTVNDRLIISGNGVGTAAFNPRPGVAEFLRKKERRRRLPDPLKYKTRDFVKKLFRADLRRPV